MYIILTKIENFFYIKKETVIIHFSLVSKNYITHNSYENIAFTYIEGFKGFAR